MNSISGMAKASFNVTVRFLNQPLVKEGIKNVASTATFAFGVLEIYDLCQIMRGRVVSSDRYPNYPKWVQVADKVVVVCAKISLVLSTGVSRPGVYIISTLVGRVASTAQLERVFGPSTIFAVNPWHPRHIFSIVAVLLALPAIAQSACKGVNWAYHKVRYHAEPGQNRASGIGISDTKIRFMNLFNTLTSRPVLHIGNQLGRRILRAA